MTTFIKQQNKLDQELHIGCEVQLSDSITADSIWLPLLASIRLSCLMVIAKLSKNNQMPIIMIHNLSNKFIKLCQYNNIHLHISLLQLKIEFAGEVQIAAQAVIFPSHQCLWKIHEFIYLWWKNSSVNSVL